MTQVIIDGYSTFYDLRTDTQFNPVLQPNGCFVGVAEVEEHLASQFLNRGGFHIVEQSEAVLKTDDELTAGEFVGTVKPGRARDGGPMPPA